jgi:branched-chain amino acid transport system permease protein
VLHLGAGDAAIAGAVAAAALSFQGAPAVLAVAVALAGGALVSAGMEEALVRPSISRPALALALLVLGGVVVRQGLAAMFTDVHTLPAVGVTWTIGDGVVHAADVVAAGVSIVLALACGLVLARTRAGAALRVTAAEPGAAELAGVDTARVRLAAFAAAGLLAAVAVVLAASRVPPAPAAAVPLALKGLTAAAVGGLRSPLTALAGAVAVGGVEVWGGHWLGGGYGEALVYAAGVVALATLGRRA